MILLKSGHSLWSSAKLVIGSAVKTTLQLVPSLYFSWAKQMRCLSCVAMGEMPTSYWWALCFTTNATTISSVMSKLGSACATGNSWNGSLLSASAFPRIFPGTYWKVGHSSRTSAPSLRTYAPRQTPPRTRAPWFSDHPGQSPPQKHLLPNNHAWRSSPSFFTPAPHFPPLSFLSTPPSSSSLPSHSIPSWAKPPLLSGWRC